MSDYILSPYAQRDLRQIQRHYLKHAGEHIARRMTVEFVAAFRALAQTPGMGHRRPDLAEDRPLWFWAVREYLIVYRADRKPLEIHSVLHGTRNVPKLLRTRG